MMIYFIILMLCSILKLLALMQVVLIKNEKRENPAYTSRLEERRKDIPHLFKEFYEMIRGEEPDAQRMEIIWEAARVAQEK